MEEDPTASPPETAESSPTSTALPEEDPPLTATTRSQSVSIEVNHGTSATEAQNSFSADSPYYNAYVDREVRSIMVMQETLRDISGRTKTFGKCGSLMSEATKRLALSCRLRRPLTEIPANADDRDEMIKQQAEQEERDVTNRRHAIGDDMAGLLTVMSEMLEEIADAQVQMCQSFEATLVTSLEHFADMEMSTSKQLKGDAEQATSSAEKHLAKYLNGKHAAALSEGETIGGNDAWNKFSEQVGSHGQNFLSRFKKKDHLKTNLSQGLSPPKPSSSHSKVKTKSGGPVSEDPMVQAAATAANLRLTLEQVRVQQATAELKRFQLLKHIVAHKQRRQFEIGDCVLASMHGVRAYYHRCSDLVTGMVPTMNRFQIEQESARSTLQEKLAPSWQAREIHIEGTIGGLKEVSKSASVVVEAIAGGSKKHMERQVTDLEEIESQVDIWSLPNMLSDSTRLQRDPTPGVVMEGWLYKKSAQRISLHPWAKRWFMMHNDGFYYFRSKEEVKKAQESTNGAEPLGSLARHKVCDIVLCTVREAPQEGPRFCFEVVTPNQKPLMLQARGPQEYRKWIDGIRNAIEMQLVHGNPTALTAALPSTSNRPKSLSRESSFDGGAIHDQVNAPEFHDIDNEQRQFAEDSAKAAKFQKSELVPELLTKNPKCADCGTASPDWVSLNLGVLVCIECSGIHRSLGVHVSKVRSLKLDSLTDPEARVIMCIGNENANEVWEAGANQQKGWEKPGASAGRKVKEEWIKSKYLWRGFLLHDEKDGKSHTERENKFCKDMYEAAKQGDLLAMNFAMAHGAVAAWQNPDDEDRTALHVAARYKPDADEDAWKAIECAELLIQNGAKMDTRDSSGLGVLDFAVLGSADDRMIDYLNMKVS